jgi:transposase
MPKDRKNYTAKEKVAILRRHLLDHVPVSQLCDEYQLQPTVFYRWQKQFFENGDAAFVATAPKGNHSALEQKVSALEERLRRKHEVLSELMEEHIHLKKELGEL